MPDPRRSRRAHGRSFLNDAPGRWHTSSGAWRWDLVRRTNSGHEGEADARGEDPGWYVTGPGQLSESTMGDHCTDFESALGHTAQVAHDWLLARAGEPDRCSCGAPEACVGPCPADRSADRWYCPEGHRLYATLDRRVVSVDGRPVCLACGQHLNPVTDSGESEVRPPAGDSPMSRTVDSGPAEPLADTFLGASGRLGDAIKTAVAAALVPGARHAIEAKLEEERAAIELAAVAGMATDSAIAEARRRFAACSPSMTLTGAMRSVARDLMHGDWTPTA